LFKTNSPAQKDTGQDFTPIIPNHTTLLPQKYHHTL